MKIGGDLGRFGEMFTREAEGAVGVRGVSPTAARGAAGAVAGGAADSGGDDAGRGARE
jgi:hypothetical protein